LQTLTRPVTTFGQIVRAKGQAAPKPLRAAPFSAAHALGGLLLNALAVANAKIVPAATNLARDLPCPFRNKRRAVQHSH